MNISQCKQVTDLKINIINRSFVAVNFHNVTNFDDFAKDKCLHLTKLTIRQQQFSVSWAMSCFYVHISNGSLMILSVAMLVLIIMNFCITFIVVLGMMIGLLLSSWRIEILRIRDDDFRVLLVMAEGCQRQN